MDVVCLISKKETFNRKGYLLAFYFLWQKRKSQMWKVKHAKNRQKKNKEKTSQITKKETYYLSLPQGVKKLLYFCFKYIHLFSLKKNNSYLHKFRFCELKRRTTDDSTLNDAQHPSENGNSPLYRERIDHI